MARQAEGVSGVTNKVVEFDKLEELPDSWEWVPLGELMVEPKVDIVDGPFGSNLKASEYTDTGIHIARLQNIDRNLFVYKNIRYISSEKAEQLDRHNFKPGDILITKLGAPLGKACIASKKILYGIIVADLVRVRIRNNNITREYLTYAINSPFLVKQFERHTKGTTRPRVNLGVIRKLPIPVAPQNEQKRIVAEIEKQFSRLDEAVDNLKRVKANLKRYKASALKAAVEGKLTEEWRKKHPDVEPADKLLERILAERRKKWEEVELAKMKDKGKEPKDNKWKKKYKEPVKPDLNGLPKLSDGWVWSSVDGLGEIVTGTTPSTKKKEYYGGDIPFFKPTELNQGYSVTSAAVYLTEIGAEKARLIPPHSVMVTCIGTTIGKVGFSRVHGTTNQQLNTLIPDKRYLYSQYLFFACISPFFFKKIIDNASSTTLPIINKSKFAALPIMVPPFKEQTIIVDEIERCLSIIDEVDLAVDVCIQRAGHLRQSILKKAFSGKLVAQDENNEFLVSSLK